MPFDLNSLSMIFCKSCFVYEILSHVHGPTQNNRTPLYHFQQAITKK